VEFAIALPALLLFTFAGVEFARVNMIRNTAANAAYEGARAGITPGSTAADCEAAANRLLNFTGISGGTAVATPNPILPDSRTVTVTVTVPISAANSFLTPQFYIGKSLVSSVALPREAQF
jgi:Flp pilus assembly protein TadG